MIEQGRGGKVVLLSSTRGKLGHPAGYSGYCASKSAVDGLVRALACEWGKHRINVNVVALGAVDAKEVPFEQLDEKGKERLSAMFKSYPIARGCAAAYFPEANVLVPVGSVAQGSNQPASKSVIVTVEPSAPNRS